MPIMLLEFTSAVCFVLSMEMTASMKITCCLEFSQIMSSWIQHHDSALCTHEEGRWNISDTDVDLPGFNYSHYCLHLQVTQLVLKSYLLCISFGVLIPFENFCLQLLLHTYIPRHLLVCVTDGNIVNTNVKKGRLCKHLGTQRRLRIALLKSFSCVPESPPSPCILFFC